MQQVDLVQLLKVGNLASIQGNMNEEEIIKIFGQPEEVESYGDKGKYFHYGFLRIGFTEDRVCGITIFFINTAATFQVKTEDKSFMIKKTTPMTTVLALLNDLKLQWEIPYQDSRFDYGIIKLSNGVKIIYYLHTDQLERISVYLGS